MPHLAFDQDREVSRRDLLDPVAHDANLGARSDERRRFVGTAPRQRPTSARALELDDQPGELRGGGEHQARVLVGRARRIEDRLQARPPVDGRDGHFARHQIRTVDRLAVLAKRDGAGRQQRPELLLETLAHEPRLTHPRQAARQRRNQRRSRTSSVRQRRARRPGRWDHRSSQSSGIDDLCKQAECQRRSAKNPRDYRVDSSSGGNGTELKGSAGPKTSRLTRSARESPTRRGSRLPGRSRAFSLLDDLPRIFHGD